MQFDEMDVPKTWVMAGECLRHMGQMKEAKDYLEQGIIAGQPLLSSARPRHGLVDHCERSYLS